MRKRGSDPPLSSTFGSSRPSESVAGKLFPAATAAQTHVIKNFITNRFIIASATGKLPLLFANGAGTFQSP